MSKQREALQLALEALTEVTGWQWVGPMRVMDEVEGAIAAIREALAEPEQEPVVEFLGRRRTPEGTRECWGVLLCDFMQDPAIGTKLYTAPPPRKPLTMDQLETCREEANRSYRRFKKIIRGQVVISEDDWEYHFARAIERAHGIGD